MKTPFTLATLGLTSALSCLMLVGCQSSSKSMLSHPLSTEALEELRTEFAASDAGARVGSVDDVKESLMYLAVGQVKGTDFPVGTVVAIVDSNKQVIALGTVEQVFDSTVHVKYEKKTDQRSPALGDAAVKFTEKF